MWANFISHYDEGAIFHNSRGELFHIRHKPNISLSSSPHRQNRGQIRTATHLPKPFKNPSHSKIIYKAMDATKFWTDLNQRKPSSGRKGDHEVVEGACATLKSDETLLQRALPRSPAAPAFGPGRKHALLPALAKNMPPAYFLNASRPPGETLIKS